MYLIHHGVEGQKWGIRRFQNEDGTLTPEGRRRYRIAKARAFIGYEIGHYQRNDRNTELPRNDYEAERMGWRKLSKKESAMHQFNKEDDVDNSKWISEDGHKEVVFTGKGKHQHITEDVRDEGTYNYYDPQKHPVGHAIADVLPYLILGNEPHDPTTTNTRISESLKNLKKTPDEIDENVKKKGKASVMSTMA